jgi:hypothetical protein
MAFLELYKIAKKPFSLGVFVDKIRNPLGEALLVNKSAVAFFVRMPGGNRDAPRYFLKADLTETHCIPLLLVRRIFSWL